jgi:hypothetical protein
MNKNVIFVLVLVFICFSYLGLFVLTLFFNPFKFAQSA